MHRHIINRTITEEEEIEDTLPSQLVDTITIPKSKLKLLPRLSKGNTVNNNTVNNQEDTNKVKVKDKDNGHPNNLLKHTISRDSTIKVKMEMATEVTE